MPVSMLIDEDRELELLRDERRQPERDHDRDDRHQQRHQPGDDRAEDEQQDDQRRGQAELELAVLEVLLREEVEVVIERLRARHGDARSAPLSSAASTFVDQRLRLVVVEQRQRDDRRVAVLRDEPGVRAVEVRAGVRERADLAVVDEAPHERLEPRRVDRVLVGADHDDVGDRRRGPGGKARQPHIVGALRLRVVRRLALRREAPTEQRDDRSDRERDDDDPGAHRPPADGGRSLPRASRWKASFVGLPSRRRRIRERQDACAERA